MDEEKGVRRWKWRGIVNDDGRDDFGRYEAPHAEKRVG